MTPQLRALAERRRAAHARLAAARQEVWAARDEVVAAVRAAHDEQGMTDQAIGEAMGIARATINQYRLNGKLHGHRDVPPRPAADRMTPDQLRALAERRRAAHARLAAARQEVWAARDEVVAAVRAAHDEQGMTDQAIGEAMDIDRRTINQYRLKGRVRSGSRQIDRDAARVGGEAAPAHRGEPPRSVADPEHPAARAAASLRPTAARRGRVQLTVQQLAELRAAVESPDVPETVAARARIVLWHAEGRRKKEVAALAGVTRPTVDLWLRRYGDEGIAGLLDRPRREARVPATIRALRKPQGPSAHRQR